MIQIEADSPTRTRLGALALAFVLLAARLPFWNHPTPTHPDEVSFVGAIGFPKDYPVHAPGYPLWVAIGTMLNTITPTPYAAYALASLIASILGAVLLFFWLQPTFDRRLAWTTSLAFGLCPLAWFHSVTALTYWAATLVGLGIVVTCERAIDRPTSHSVWAAASLLCIGVFLRTDCLIYFGPLFVWTILRTRSARTLPATLVPVAACAGFYLLMHFLYGRSGPTVFEDRFGHSRAILIGTSLFGAGLVDGLLRNCVKILGNLAWNVGPLAIVCLASFLLHRGRGTDALHDAGNSSAPIAGSLRHRILALWLATGLTFLALFHVVEGYFLWILPAFYIAAAGMLRRRVGPARAGTLMAVVAVLLACQFLLYPWSTTCTGALRSLNAKISYLSAQGLMHIDERARIHEDGDVWHIKAHDDEKKN
ncbi:MAG: hypothetical protein H6818_05110 [Phycisphaerales bacterium]|nr:hypothetical protein [Phycisphaerales bacterium]MCB9863436.1 hypothetical protein [Phycisphaerales bacterium]